MRRQHPFALITTINKYVTLRKTAEREDVILLIFKTNKKPTAKTQILRLDKIFQYYARK